MPARSARITLWNATGGYDLVKFDQNVCHGEVFDLPERIASGTSGEWRAESSGSIPIVGDIGTGTEGWVKYRVESPVGAPGGGDICLIYWANPFAGPRTFFGPKISKQNLKADKSWDAYTCNDDNTPDPSSTFSTPSQFDFFATRKAWDGEKMIGVVQGEVGDEGGIVVIIPIPGLAEISEHAWFEIGLYDTLRPSLRNVFHAMRVDVSTGIRSFSQGRSFKVRDVLRV